MARFLIYCGIVLASAAIVALGAKSLHHQYRPKNKIEIKGATYTADLNKNVEMRRAQLRRDHAKQQKKEGINTWASTAE